MCFAKKISGPSSARNFGIKKCNGDYIIFLDSDDRLEKDIIESLVNILMNKDYDIILFTTVFEMNDKISTPCSLKSFEFNENDIDILNNSIYDKFEKFNQILTFDGVEGKIIKKDFIKENKVEFPEDTFRFEDAIFCKQLYSNCKKMYFLSKIGCYYVQNNESICHKYNDKICEAAYIALKYFYNMIDNKQLFYIKCLTTLSECEKLYFFNKYNRKSYFKIRNDYSNMLKKDLYKETLKKIKLKSIPIHYKLEAILLKLGFLDVYFIFKKIYFRFKKEWYDV